MNRTLMVEKVQAVTDVRVNALLRVQDFVLAAVQVHAKLKVSTQLGVTIAVKGIVMEAVKIPVVQHQSKY